MAAAKTLAGTADCRVPYIFAAVFKMYSLNSARKIVSSRNDYLATLEAPDGTSTGFRDNVITSKLRLDGPLSSIIPAECGNCFWILKGMIVNFLFDISPHSFSVSEMNHKRYQAGIAHLEYSNDFTIYKRASLWDNVYLALSANSKSEKPLLLPARVAVLKGKGVQTSLGQDHSTTAPKVSLASSADPPRTQNMTMAGPGPGKLLISMLFVIYLPVEWAPGC